MDKGLAHKGKKDVEKKWPIPDAARAGADLCYASSPSAIGYAVATPAKKKRMYETEAQVCRRKKKTRRIGRCRRGRRRD
jgi:hypothetical protein